MNLAQTFGVYSERHKTANRSTKPLTPEFRHRTLQLCTNNFAEFTGLSTPASMSTFWSHIHEKFRILLGRPTLTDTYPVSTDEETVEFLLSCSDEHFLAFVEMIFQSKQPWISNSGINLHKLVEDVNTLFEVDDLPYFLTRLVPTPNARRIVFTSYPDNPPVEVYPQVICKEDEVLHQHAIGPTLLLLTEPYFASANREFLEALRDYRKGDYRDSVGKCGSSLESVMKVICARKKWAYKETDTVSKLLKNILSQTALDSFYESPIMLIATIRNRYSTAHGAGTQKKTVSKNVANYVINATASAILLLVHETSP